MLGPSWGDAILGSLAGPGLTLVDWMPRQGHDLTCIEDRSSFVRKVLSGAWWPQGDLLGIMHLSR